MKIAIVGVESSGKTTLCNQLSDHFNIPVVPEYSREYLKEIGLNYTEKDLLSIAEGQVELERRVEESDNSLVICDANLLVIIIWSVYKYGRCHPRIKGLHSNSKYDLTFLTYYDIPWENDELRENPNELERKELHEMYLKYLEMSNSRFVVLKGNPSERFEIAKDQINRLMNT